LLSGDDFLLFGPNAPFAASFRGEVGLENSQQLVEDHRLPNSLPEVPHLLNLGAFVIHAGSNQALGQARTTGEPTWMRAEGIDPEAPKYDRMIIRGAGILPVGIQRAASASDNDSEQTFRWVAAHITGGAY